MNLRSRLTQLEKVFHEQSASDFALFNGEGVEVEAKIVRMPEADRYGIALMQDGTRMPVDGQIGGCAVILAGQRDRLYWGRGEPVILISAIERPAGWNEHRELLLRGFMEEVEACH